MASDSLQPLVSVVTPAHNSARYISEAIQSVRNQTHSNWEMIIVDDASTDGTGEIVSDWSKKDPRIRYFRLNENGGVARARNLALSEARGDYLSFLDSDDLWLEDKISVQVAYMRESKAALCCSQYRRISADGSQIGNLIKVPSRIDYKILLKGNPIGFLTAMIDRRQCGELRLLDVGHEDYVLWLSILKRGIVAHGVQKDLARYRVGANSLSSIKTRTAKWMWHIYRNIEQLSLPVSAWYFAHYALKGYIKHREL